MKFNFESWQEFLDWNVKRENHIKELEEDNRELELGRLRDARQIEELKTALKNATAENSDE